MSTNKMADARTHMSNSPQNSDNKLKYTTFIGNTSSPESKVEDGVSLQEAFKRYRKARQVSALNKIFELFLF